MLAAPELLLLRRLLLLPLRLLWVRLTLCLRWRMTRPTLRTLLLLLLLLVLASRMSNQRADLSISPAHSRLPATMLLAGSRPRRKGNTLPKAAVLRDASHVKPSSTYLQGQGSCR